MLAEGHAEKTAAVQGVILLGEHSVLTDTAPHHLCVRVGLHSALAGIELVQPGIEPHLAVVGGGAGRIIKQLPEGVRQLRGALPRSFLALAMICLVVSSSAWVSPKCTG